MCCGGMSYNPYAFTVSNLKPGDEVIVSGLDHEGNEHEKETVIVYRVSGFSFLSTSGFGFGAGVMSYLLVTGTHYEDPKPSEKALRVLAEIESRRLAEESGYELTGELENFDSEPE